MTGVRLYGRLVGHGSHARVTAGFRSVLEQTGQLAGCVALDLERPPEETPEPGALAPHGVFTGALGMLPRMTHNARHDWRWAMVAPNSDRLPVDLCAALAHYCTDIMLPSQWARRVAERQEQYLAPLVAARFSRLRLHVVPHGIDREFSAHGGAAKLLARQLREDEVFQVLHFSTSDRQRKGTLELLRGWRIALPRLPRRAALHLILDAPASAELRVAAAEASILMERVEILGRMDFAPRPMALALKTAHLVCQPSRGEAFGMVPLEARAVGTPVAATLCTGHSEHMTENEPGVVPIAEGPLAPIDDLPMAMAPSVAPDDIALALVTAAENWHDLSAAAVAAAPTIAEQWHWQRQLGAWLAGLP